MPHIGVESFAAGDDEEDAAHDDESGFSMMEKESGPVQRVEGVKDHGILGDLDDPEDGEGGEPGEHHPAKPLSDGARAFGLHGEKGDENHDGEGNDHGANFVGGSEEAFDGGKDGDGGGDDAVAIE